MYSDRKKKDIILKYTKEMEIIKLRIDLIFSLKNNLGYIQPTVEFLALQLRKIIEQIVLSSLITNSEKYREYYNKLGSVWRIDYICKDIEEINEDFFPTPVVDDHEAHELKDRDGCINKEKLLEAHTKMGKLLHAENPFGTEIDYEEMREYIFEICRRIIELLNSHITKLYGGNSFLYVIMREESNGKVAIDWFEKSNNS